MPVSTGHTVRSNSCLKKKVKHIITADNEKEKEMNSFEKLNGTEITNDKKEFGMKLFATNLTKQIK